MIVLNFRFKELRFGLHADSIIFMDFLHVPYSPTCRESGKGDDHCVIGDEPCQTCAGFTEEQLLKSKHRRRFVRKQKASDTFKDDLDLLGDDVEAFSGSQADLEGAADDLFSSPPRPQPLRFESLSLKTPQTKTVPPTPGTALQNKIESKLEKSLGQHINIQLQQQMGVFQSSMLEAMKSLRDEMQAMKKASEAGLDETSASVSKAGPSKMPDPITHPITRMFNPWKWTCVVLLFHPGCKMCSPIMAPSTRILNPITWILNPITWNDLQGCVPLKSKSTWTKTSTRFGQNTPHNPHPQTVFPEPLFSGGQKPGVNKNF